MSFIGRTRTTLGPRGRNVSTARAVQGYVRDDHSFTRGPGAIAALDAASPRRRVARAKALGADAARDLARARVAMGPALRAASSANGQARAVMRPTVLPGMQVKRAVQPGSIPVAKYPGVPGYQPFVGGKATKPGSIVGARAGGASGFSRGTDVVARGAYTGTSTGGGYGAPQTGVTVGTPQAGGVTQQPGQIDPGSGGGGGGGDYGTPGDSGGGGGGGGTDPGYDPGADPGADPGTDPSSTDPSAGGGADPNADLTAITASTPSTPAISSSTRNMLIAGAALLGAYMLFKKD